jgi:hypothetical protein
VSAAQIARQINEDFDLPVKITAKHVNDVLKDRRDVYGRHPLHFLGDEARGSVESRILQEGS